MVKKRRVVNCMGCKHHVITWDKSFPYACKFWGFRGKRLPCYTVVQATGTPCTEYVDVKIKKKSR